MCVFFIPIASIVVLKKYEKACSTLLNVNGAFIPRDAARPPFDSRYALNPHTTISSKY